MTEASSSLSLFHVTKRYKNPTLDRLKYARDSYGEIYESTELAVGSRAEEAVDIEYQKMEEEKRRTWQRIVDIRNRIIPKPNLPIHEPKTPVEKEKWRAKEVIIPGYEITVRKTD